MTNTDTANDLRIRVYGRDSGSAAWTLDAMTVAGSPGFSTYVLYPFQLIDTADGASRTTRWGPAGP